MEQLCFSNLYRGRQLRDEGIALVESHEPEDWQIAARIWLRRRAAMPGDFNADDLRKAVGPPSRPNAMGAAFLWAVRAGVIERVGYRSMTRPIAHARRTAIYRGHLTDYPVLAPARL